MQFEDYKIMGLYKSLKSFFFGFSLARAKKNKRHI
jgi:hypothetical protein